MKGMNMVPPGDGERPTREIAERHLLAHDLRTPLRAISIYAEVLLHSGAEADTSEVERCCAGIIEAVDQLRARIDTFAGESDQH